MPPLIPCVAPPLLIPPVDSDVLRGGERLRVGVGRVCKTACRGSGERSGGVDRVC